MYSNTIYPKAVKIKQKVREIKTQKLYSLNAKPSIIDMDILEEEINIGETTFYMIYNSHKYGTEESGLQEFVLDDVTIFGIAKRLEEIYFSGESTPIYIDKKYIV